MEYSSKHGFYPKGQYPTSEKTAEKTTEKPSYNLLRDPRISRVLAQRLHDLSEAESKQRTLELEMEQLRAENARLRQARTKRPREEASTSTGTVVKQPPTKKVRLNPEEADKKLARYTRELKAARKSRNAFRSDLLRAEARESDLRDRCIELTAEKQALSTKLSLQKKKTKKLTDELTLAKVVREDADKRKLFPINNKKIEVSIRRQLVPSAEDPTQMVEELGLFGLFHYMPTSGYLGEVPREWMADPVFKDQLWGVVRNEEDDMQVQLLEEAFANTGIDVPTYIHEHQLEDLRQEMAADPDYN